MTIEVRINFSYKDTWPKFWGSTRFHRWNSRYMLYIIPSTVQLKGSYSQALVPRVFQKV